MGQSWSQEEDAYLIFPMEYNGGAYIPVLPTVAGHARRARAELFSTLSQMIARKGGIR